MAVVQVLKSMWLGEFEILGGHPQLVLQAPHSTARPPPGCQLAWPCQGCSTRRPHVRHRAHHLQASLLAFAQDAAPCDPMFSNAPTICRQALLCLLRMQQPCNSMFKSMTSIRRQAYVALPDLQRQCNHDETQHKDVYDVQAGLCCKRGGGGPSVQNSSAM